MIKIVSLVCAIALTLGFSSAAVAGSLTAAQRDQLTQMAIQVLGPVPTDGNYGGASITGSTSQMPEGRTDCVRVKVVDEHGTWQRWKCGPGLGTDVTPTNTVGAGDWSAWGAQPHGRTDCRPADMSFKLYPVGTAPMAQGRFKWACPN